jgi:hypothetical protein
LASALVLELRCFSWPGSVRAETDSCLDNVPAGHFVGPPPSQDQTLAGARCWATSGHFHQPIGRMTLSNMRELGVRSTFLLWCAAKLRTRIGNGLSENRACIHSSSPQRRCLFQWWTASSRLPEAGPVVKPPADAPGRLGASAFWLNGTFERRA